MTTTLRAYHADPVLRESTIARMREHARLDQIVQGTYAKGEGDAFRGCLVGCAIHDDQPEGRHAAFPRVFGIPKVLAHLADRIFEGLTPAEAKALPVAFFKASPLGADLSLAWPRCAVALMIEPEHGVARLTDEGSRARAAIVAVAALYQRVIDGGTVSREEWDAADAARYASAAPYAARYASAAPYAARYASAAAAHYDWQASTLLAILASCPVES